MCSTTVGSTGRDMDHAKKREAQTAVVQRDVNDNLKKSASICYQLKAEIHASCGCKTKHERQSGRSHSCHSQGGCSERTCVLQWKEIHKVTETHTVVCIRVVNNKRDRRNPMSMRCMICLFVCAYVCACMLCVCVSCVSCVCVCVCVCLCACVCVCVCVCVCMCMCVCRACVCVFVCMGVCMRVYVCVCACGVCGVCGVCVCVCV